MPPKAIFAQTASDYWVDVAAKLREDHGWEICYFIGRKRLEKALKLFPQAVFHTRAEIRKKQIPNGCDAVMPSPLDKPLLSSLFYYESIFLKMMDRESYDGSLGYYDRISTYHTQLMYWKGVLEHFKPDVVVFRIAPHRSHEYPLYALCRIMNIPTIMFERTSLPGFVYPVRSFEEGSEIIRKTYTKWLTQDYPHMASLSPETESYLKNISKTYASAMPFHLQYKLKHYKNKGDIAGPVSILYDVVKDLAKTFYNKKDAHERVPNYMRKRYYKKIGRLKRKKLLLHYNRLAKQVNLTVPYIFVALQCEPERQTCPVGDIFSNQYLMIDMLSKLAPPDWKIYVKEHPSQFKEYQAAERAKSVAFYNMIAAMPKVELVSLTYTSFDLITHAKASATVSGTVGWESVVRGKPTLLFGHSWYKDCKGIFMTQTIEDCKNAIDKIKSGYQINPDEVRCFAKAVESCSVRGYIDKLYDKMNLISPEENVNNLARAIHEFAS